MTSKHILKFDGYEVGDRLLEGVDFDVEITDENNELTVGEIVPSKDAYPYVENIRWENYIGAIRKQVENNIGYLANWLKDQEVERSFQEEFKLFEEETGEPGVQMLLEV